jgi:hypothetical protein
MAKDLFGGADCWPFDEDYLRSILEYNPETGRWTWLITPRHGQIKKGDPAGNITGAYRTIMINQRSYLSATLAWLYMTGEWPRFEVDHIDRIKTNDRWNNFRLATRRQQMGNAFWSNNTSGAKGVYWHRRSGKWCAQIQVNRLVSNLGYYDKIEDAIEARRKASEKNFGEFDVLMEPDDEEPKLIGPDLFK